MGYAHGSVGDLEVVFEYDYTPEQGDGWHEPRYDAEVELTKIETKCPKTGVWVDITAIWDALTGSEQESIEQLLFRDAEEPPDYYD